MLGLRIGDGTHHKKRHAIRTKGETPIEKNVAVTDEQGNTYESTYPRRARGLVKHGRARWMEDNRICLTCPPEQIAEISEDDMNDNQIAYIKEQIEFLKAELERSNNLSFGPEFQPAAAVRIIASRDGMRKQILELIERMGNPQYEDRAAQERQYYREMLVKISSDDKALQAAKDVACECDEDETRQAIINDTASQYEATKREIAKAILEKLT